MPIFNKTFKPKENSEDFYRTSYYLRDIIRGKIEDDNFIILREGYRADIEFYVNILTDNGKNISLKNSEDVKMEEYEILNLK